jgi:hypothetical protein
VGRMYYMGRLGPVGGVYVHTCAAKHRMHNLALVISPKHAMANAPRAPLLLRRTKAKYSAADVEKLTAAFKRHFPVEYL